MLRIRMGFTRIRIQPDPTSYQKPDPDPIKTPGSGSATLAINIKALHTGNTGWTLTVDKIPIIIILNGQEVLANLV